MNREPSERWSLAPAFATAHQDIPETLRCYVKILAHLNPEVCHYWSCNNILALNLAGGLEGYTLEILMHLILDSKMLTWTENEQLVLPWFNSSNLALIHLRNINWIYTAVCHLAVPKCHLCQSCTSSDSIHLLFMACRMPSTVSCHLLYGFLFSSFTLHVHTISILSFSLCCCFFTTHSSTFKKCKFILKELNAI